MAAKKRGAKKQSTPPPPRLWVPKLGVFLLRVFTGALFIDAVYYKLYLTRMRAPATVAGEEGGLGLGLIEAFNHFVEHDYKPLVQHAIDFPPELFGAPMNWYSKFSANVLMPGAVPDVLGPAVLIFELLLGIALVLGTGVRLMAGLGAALMLVFGMSKGMYFLSISGTNWILFFVLIALATSAAGRMWGLDSRLSRRLPGWVS